MDEITYNQLRIMATVGEIAAIASDTTPRGVEIGLKSEVLSLVTSLLLLHRGRNFCGGLRPALTQKEFRSNLDEYAATEFNFDFIPLVEELSRFLATEDYVDTEQLFDSANAILHFFGLTMQDLKEFHDE